LTLVEMFEWSYLWLLCNNYLVPFLGWMFLFGIISHSLPIFIVRYLLAEQNLKNKYKANWAFVSGASSGLGFAIADKLAKQGLNLIMCALDDAILTESHSKLQSKYPSLEIRKVGCDLGDTKGSYMPIIKHATKDISVQIVFSNAGYIVISLFPKTQQDRLLKNWNCNITSHIEITHYFFEKLVNEKKKVALFSQVPMRDFFHHLLRHSMGPQNQQ